MRAVVLLLLAPLLAGCLSDGEAPEPVEPEDEAVPAPFVEVSGVSCGSCFEPTLAVHDGTLLMSAGGHTELFRRTADGWEALPGPEAPGLEGNGQGDVFIQADDQGRLWWTALAYSPAGAAGGVLVAMSPDGGSTWPLRHTLHWPHPALGASAAPDRQWLAVEGDTVVVACTCPAVAAPLVRVSTDGGATFGEPLPVPVAQGRPGPLGPVVLREGVLVVPFLVTTGASPSNPLQAEAAVATSADLGRTWTRTMLGGGPTVCCAFPNAVAQEDGFRVAWTGTAGVHEARSPDGLSWNRTDGWGDGTGTTYPHAWPVQGAEAVVWAAFPEAGVTSMVISDASGGEMVGTHFGSFSGRPGDYVHGVLHDGFLVTVWPVDGSLSLGFAPLAARG